MELYCLYSEHQSPVASWKGGDYKKVPLNFWAAVKFSSRYTKFGLKIIHFQAIRGKLKFLSTHISCVENL